VLEHFGLPDLDQRSLQQYRQRFASRAPQHPWLKESEQGFLERLGGWQLDRATGKSGLTVAGLLMFGKDEAIRDPAGVPQYHVDFRERLSSDPAVRWTDRIWPDGTWVANLFQFFERVYPRLVVDLKIPFQFTPLRPGETTTTDDPSLFQRHDETIVHEAIREALVNALIHADFRGQGGIVVERYRDRLEFSNPGTLLIGIDQILKGGISECRNKILQGMFAMLGYGEKAGSGIDKIRQGWASQKWRWPIIEQQIKPDRVRLVLPMVSLLPEECLTALRMRFGQRFDSLSGREVQALVTAEVEGTVTNLRLRQFCDDHTSDITRMLQDLVAKGFLEKDGYGRWASYRLPEPPAGSGHSEAGTPDTGVADSGHSGTGSGSPVLARPDLPPEQNPILLAIAEPARRQERLDPAQMRQLIRQLCQEQFLTFRQLAALLKREPTGLQRWHLRPMAQDDQLLLLHPTTPNHPKQAYRTNPDWKQP